MAGAEGTTRTLAELATLVAGELAGPPDLAISGLNDLAGAVDGEITFVSDGRRLEELAACRASAVILPMAVAEAGRPAIRVRNPYLAAAIIHNQFLARPFAAAGIHPTAVIGSRCRIPDAVTIGPHAVIGNGVQLGERVTIGPGVVIGDEAVIGDDALLHANVTIVARSVLGKRVIIHPGAVIGSDGFGYATDEAGRHVKRPHVGIVQLDDDVEIGANACIDRGTFGRTWVKAGAKIDNLVQLGHNVVIGEHSFLVAQVGIAGSTKTGHHVVMGGQVGLAGHLDIGNGVMIAAKSGVHDDQPDGAIIAGIPAIPHKKWLRASAAVARLPELLKELRELKRQVAELLSGKK
ncbi:MAG: UDP-3-O-(3-hydroxymyristoyl)glucosamine N-acyltransferase [Thermodesulfobacteriota bacterium]